MPKRPKFANKPLRRSDDEPRPSYANFHTFLAAADAVALELLVREGILSDPRIDRSFYEDTIERLAKRFCEPWPSSADVDNVHYDELDAKLNAAHMVGFALGLRLRGVDLAAPKGGAR